MRHKLVSLLVLSTVLWSARIAVADTVGTLGTVAGLQINAGTADTYLTYHGQVFVKTSKVNTDSYRWGGVSCGTRVLTDAQVAELQRALEVKRLKILPLYQIGQGEIKCLVGFALGPKPLLDSLVP